jgi:hypothetical protein
MGKIKQLYFEVTESIRKCLYNDLTKYEIREIIKDMYPDLPRDFFEECYTEAFTSL